MSLHLSPPLPAHETVHLDGLDFPQPLPLGSISQLPAGLHLLAWEPAPGPSGMPPARRGVFFHTTSEEHQTNRAWDEDAESLRTEGASSLAAAPDAAASSASQRPAAVSYPLPASASQAWAAQTRLLSRSPNVLKRVLGSELRIDAGHSLVHPELPRGQRPSRAERALDEHLGESTRFRGKLAFTQVKLRQSWAEAVGEERSRWSEDKSLALAAALEAAGGATSLLAEFELAWLLFMSLQSSAALTHWQVLLELFCRSGALLGAPLPPISGATSVEGPAQAVEVHPAFLRVLCAQMTHLRSSFFHTDMPTLQGWLEGELAELRRSIVAALAAWPGTSTGQGEDAPEAAPLIAAWRDLAMCLRSRFEIDIEAKRDEEIMVEDELGEGDEAPLVVEL